ncbi:unnamed protein product [Ilex paraguariensis]
MKLLADKNKIVELSGIELQKLRINLQKVQQQNLQLAQSNSQMVGELNTGKDRLKALLHELGCKNGLLKVKELALKEKMKAKAKTKMCQKIDSEVEASNCKQDQESVEPDREYNKPCTPKQGQQSKSLGTSTVKQVQAKENTENKRLCVRRQSARLKSEESKPTEDFFEIEEAKFPVCPLHDDQMQGDVSTTMPSIFKKEDIDGNCAFGRTSIGRPVRHAAQKIQSYKETPINVKMRRPA